MIHDSVREPRPFFVNATFGRLWPARVDVDMDEYLRLRSRNKWIGEVGSWLATALPICGIGVLRLLGVVNVGPLRAVVIMGGCSSLLYVAWALTVTAARGDRQLAELERWYAVRYGVSARKVLAWVLLPVIVLGFVAFAGAGTP